MLLLITAFQNQEYDINFSWLQCDYEFILIFVGLIIVLYILIDKGLNK